MDGGRGRQNLTAGASALAPAERFGAPGGPSSGRRRFRGAASADGPERGAAKMIRRRPFSGDAFGVSGFFEFLEKLSETSELLEPRSERCRFARLGRVRRDARSAEASELIRPFSAVAGAAGFGPDILPAHDSLGDDRVHLRSRS
jgi:hypothetical protein